MNAWVQWFASDQKPPGQPDTGATSERVEPSAAARGNAGPWPAAKPRVQAARLKPPEPPIRAELFSIERLEQHAESLAAAQHIASDPKQGRPLAKRLYDNAKVLTETYRAIVRTNSAHQPITPAAEWLLDNFHIVDEQIREIKERSSARLLPQAAEIGGRAVAGLSARLRRRLGTGRPYRQRLRHPEAHALRRGLSAGPAADHRRIVGDRDHLAHHAGGEFAPSGRGDRGAASASQLADALADRILGTADRSDPEPASAILRSLDQVPWSTAFAVELAQRLRDHDPNATPALRWLNERLAAEQTTTDQIVREEFQRQSAMNVTVRNVITSMRLVSMINWAEFFESVSPVDAVLRERQRFRRDGFSDTRPLPARDRGTCARIRPRRNGRGQARDSRCQKRAWTRRRKRVGARARKRSGILSHRQRPPRLREGTRVPRAVPDAALSAQFRSGRDAAMWA